MLHEGRTERMCSRRPQQNRLLRGRRQSNLRLRECNLAGSHDCSCLPALGRPEYGLRCFEETFSSLSGACSMIRSRVIVIWLN